MPQSIMTSSDRFLRPARLALTLARCALLVSCLTLISCASIAHPATRPTHCAFDENNVLLVNGKKVFPLGATKAPPPGAKAPSGKMGLQELREGGINFMRTGSGPDGWNEKTIAEEDRLMAAGAKYGVRCWVFLRELASVKDGDAKRETMLRRVITRYKDHPGLFMWKGEDEPEWGKRPVAPQARAREIIRQLDPAHPLVLIQAPRGTVETLRPYNAVCDVTGADIYPIGYPPGAHSLEPNKELSMVGDYTRKMMAVAGGKMPVWMVLQIAWSGVVKPGKTLRYPTFFEERFMVYEAIINGARGLNFFGGNVEAAWAPEDAPYQWNWTFWRRVLRPLLEEINEWSPLAPALVAPDSKLPVRVNAPDVEFCVREAGGELFILACKRGGETTQVEFTGLPAAAGSGDVLYEAPRKVTARDGKFKDWFAPYEVHVYRFAR